jgi:hypothetical protein
MLLKLPLDVVRLILELCKPIDKIMTKLSCKRLNSIIPPTKLTMYMTSCASLEGYLNILKYLCRMSHKWNGTGCTWGGYETAVAIRNRNLKILKYLHQNGCKLSEYSCTIAARVGNLEILEYLHQNGCLFTRNIFNNARDEETASYIRERMTQVPDYTEEALRAAYAELA